MSLNQKINTLSMAILVLLVVTIGLQGIMRSEQVQRKGVADKNYTRIFQKLDKLDTGQRHLNSRFDSLANARQFKP